MIGEMLAETDLPQGAFSILPVHARRRRPVHDRRAHQAAQLHRLARGRLGAQGARRQEEGGARARRQRGRASSTHDADLDDAVERIVFGAFYQSGQSCISVQRILVARRRSTTSSASSWSRRRARSSSAIRKDERHVHRPDDRREARRKRLESWIDEARRARRAGCSAAASATGAMLEADAARGRAARRRRSCCRGGLRPGRACSSRFADFDDALRRGQRQRLRPAGRRLHARPLQGACAPGTSSRSAA